jgi:hypothetical protein
MEQAQRTQIKVSYAWVQLFGNRSWPHRHNITKRRRHMPAAVPSQSAKEVHGGRDDQAI